MKRELISTIIVEKSNFEYISKTGIINGTLLIEIERVMEQYHESRMKEIPEITDEEIKEELDNTHTITLSDDGEYISQLTYWYSDEGKSAVRNFLRWYRKEQRKRMK